MKTITGTDIKGLKKISEGKVRDIYDMDDKLLIITTDRVSAFDHVLKEGIPYKGMVLNNISNFWFKKMKDIIQNHLEKTKFDNFPEKLKEYRDTLYGRSILVKKAEPVKVECIVRGFITGSGWRSYKKNGQVCGIELPDNLKESQELNTPLFTPTTKAEEGHDENITFEEMKDFIGKELATRIKNISISIYEKAKEYAKKRGIIIADTKFEFGIHDGELIIIDEILTPDSSRFWPLDEYVVGRKQKSFDKQFLRDWLDETGWDKNSKPPSLTSNVIQTTSAKYLDAYKKLTGKDLIEELDL
ncbi:MAG: phosphoribosylaminoimidazolesuccinocarboxamide synthase [Candidatus Mcinerneyibacterium aminivorans]|uniref:Phosphoribosylaminoimidazole-succinocarboxamide synthase n=1 Tax=Candidatus Mcinerneyibacterium aminivorans TaxID=2703815 RepID=A0A5D0MIP0_9BACT|nr:MAG: phosphoribosylaminoimidazolesuccinocarboxamide synthase [Candidatus Mcinerneyibacterium aminivorans]